MQRDVAPRLAGTLLQVMHDVLGDDDRRIDEQADRDGQAAERHRVDADAAGAQQESRQRDRERQRERHQQRRSPVAEQDEQHDDDEAGADQDRAADAAKRAADEIGLVVDHPQRDAFGKRLADVGERRTHGRGDGHGVGAELLDDAAAHDFAGEPMSDAAPDGRRLDDVRDVAEHDGDALLDGDDRRPQLVDGLHAADRAHRPLGAALRHESAGRVDVGVLDGVQHLVRASRSARTSASGRAESGTAGDSRRAARPPRRRAPRAAGS